MLRQFEACSNCKDPTACEALVNISVGEIRGFLSLVDGYEHRDSDPVDLFAIASDQSDETQQDTISALREDGCTHPDAYIRTIIAEKVG